MEAISPASSVDVDVDDVEEDPAPVRSPSPPPTAKLVLKLPKQSPVSPVFEGLNASFHKKEHSLKALHNFSLCLNRMIERGADELRRCYEHEVDELVENQNKKWAEIASRMEDSEHLRTRVQELETLLSKSQEREAGQRKELEAFKQKFLDIKEKRMQKKQEKAEEQKRVDALQSVVDASTSKIQELEQVVKKQKLVIETLNNAISGAI